VVFYGNVAEEGITFKEELAAIQEQLPDVRIVHVLSRPGDDWSGHRGHISAEIVNGELADPGEWTFYVCGPPPMVESMQKVLEELSIPRTQVVLEKFGAPPA
jgi:ferredoxin-NADP reductase